MPISAPETVEVTATKVACDGGEGALGHPRVWIVVPPQPAFAECGYCDKRFVLAAGAGHDAH